MLPIGWLMAAAVAAAAVGVLQLSKRGAWPSVIVLSAVAAVAAVRAVGSIWLPHVGDGLTRQHITSIGVAVASTLGLGVIVATQQHRFVSRSSV
jgi:hypothetical protein